ncbi:MAG: hypothetical protein WDM89_04475 [Rhizomicrobium sp.]
MTAGVVNIHATCVVLAKAGSRFGAPANAGVLLLGKSGAGKSDLGAPADCGRCKTRERRPGPICLWNAANLSGAHQARLKA